MPDYVLKHKNPKVGRYVLPIAEGADLNSALAPFAESGWSLDKDADPADVPPPGIPVEETPTAAPARKPAKKTAAKKAASKSSAENGSPAPAGDSATENEEN